MVGRCDSGAAGRGRFLRPRRPGRRFSQLATSAWTAGAGVSHLSGLTAPPACREGSKGPMTSRFGKTSDTPGPGPRLLRPAAER